MGTKSKKKSASSAPADELTKEQLLEMFRDMTLQRRFEEAAARAYGQGRIYGFCHLYIGQEAIATATKHARNADDPWISAYRIHAQALAAGMQPQACMDELFGKASGVVEGLGGGAAARARVGAHVAMVV